MLIIIIIIIIIGCLLTFPLEKRLQWLKYVW
jgi:hypothetical protein